MTRREVNIYCLGRKPGGKLNAPNYARETHHLNTHYTQGSVLLHRLDGCINSTRRPPDYPLGRNICRRLNDLKTDKGRSVLKLRQHRGTLGFMIASSSVRERGGDESRW